jgi:hypothetical protein
MEPVWTKTHEGGPVEVNSEGYSLSPLLGSSTDPASGLIGEPASWNMRSLETVLLLAWG